MPAPVSRSRPSQQVGPATSVAGPVTYITVMGGVSVNGLPVRSVKPIEFVAALALSGGAMARDALVARLYFGTSSQSAIPTLCYRARQIGIAVVFDSDRLQYRLVSRVCIDALEILTLAQAGDPEAALHLWRGPCLVRSTSPFATALRARLEIEMVRAVRRAGEPSTTHRAAQVIDSLELAEAALACDGDARTAVLSDSLLNAAGW